MTTISGIIYNEHDATIAAIKIEAYNKKMRHSTILGEAITDAEGQNSMKCDLPRGRSE